jgi:ABC-type sugar transport system ATPase subunit
LEGEKVFNLVKNIEFLISKKDFEVLVVICGKTTFLNI